MSERQQNPYDSVARRWLALVERRQAHFIELCDTGRWRHYYSEAEFIEELALFPQDARARAGLAMLYQATDRADAASQMLTDMLRITPTPNTYALASRIFTMFGNRQQADAVRAQARRAFTETAGSGARDARQ